MRLRIRFFVGVSPALRRGFKSVAWALVFSVGAVLLAYLAVWKLFPAAAAFSPVRVVSFVDSLLAGVVGFALLGAFAYLGSLRRPDEDAISERISYLYSARLDDNEETKSFLTRELMLLGATIRNAQSLYNFVEFDQENDTVRVNVRISMTIVNMMKWDEYVQDMPVRVMFDSVAGRAGQIGTVIRLETTGCDSHGRFGAKQEHLSQSIALIAGVRYEGSVSLMIPPHGELHYEYEYEGWVKADDNFWAGVNRFADSFAIKVTNLVDRPLIIGPNENPKRPEFVNITDVCTLQPGESSDVFALRNLKPSVPVTFRSKF